MEIANNTFIVTGAASGLGLATAEMLIAAGANVIIADRDERNGKEAAVGLGERARFVRTDVANEADAEAAIALARDIFGGLHGLVNCAGVAIGEKVLGREGVHGLANFSRTISVNLIGTFNMARLAAAAIAGARPNADGERGVIVNTASIAAFDGQIGQTAYAASKAGVAGLTLPLARELARHGIRVMTVAPGIFKTPMMAGMPQEVQDALGASVPFPTRLGEPAEYAALVRHIIENPMLNGEVIRLDGALRMAPK